MIRAFPESALVQLEFDKIKALLEAHCQMEYAKEKSQSLRVHTRKEFIELELNQTNEFKILVQNGQYFPLDYILNLAKELRLLGIPGALLTGEQFMDIRKLAENLQSIFRWFDNDRRIAHPALAEVIRDTYYEKQIIHHIDQVLDESGQVKDSASEE
ncbi:MAG: DNA mismatch repair protein MutS, partial [Chitinophagaceae bacterium]